MTNPAHHALWRDITAAPSFQPLRGKVEVDTLIVGAGITGMTAAWLLTQAGQRVAVVDMGDVGSGETGKTTSHLTVLPDGGTAALRKKHGDASATQVLTAQREAIDLMEVVCTELGASTQFNRVPAWIYSEDEAGIAHVEAERAALAALGMGAERMAQAPLPFATRAALRVEHQAQFEPMAYLAALTKRVVGGGGKVFTQSRVTHLEDGDPCRASTPHGDMTAKQILLTCHTPPNRLAYHTQIFAYRTYALAAALKVLPPQGLYFDSAEPYHYLRTQDTPQGPMLIAGGYDHKTGKREDTQKAHAALQAFVQERFAVQRVANVWSGQIMQPADLIPFVGPNGTDKHTLFAAGYSGNGLTLGTVAARILADTVLGRANPYASLFSSRRLDLGAQLGAMAKENLDVPAHMVGDRIAALAQSADGLKRGEGRVVSRGAQAVALYCDTHGKEHALSAVCPHMGCLVNWNSGERSWDCPCHGSRFSAQGKLLNGPALEDMKPVD